MNGKLLSVTFESLREIEAKLPRPRPQNAEYILVEAQVHVKETYGRVTTDPPSERAYQGVVIEELKRVRWYTPPAK